MKKICKSLAVLLVLSMLLSVLTACAAQDKLELLNAIEKTTEIRSYENHSSFEIENVSLNSNIAETAMVEPFVSMLNGLKMDMHQKVSQNNEQTIVKAQMDMSVTLEGTTEQTSIWLDYDYTKTPPDMKTIIKIPASAIGIIPGTEEGKEYLVMDESLFEDASKLAPEAYTESLESAKSFQTQLLNLIKQYAIEKDPNFVAVTQLPDRTINGEKHKVYQLKLTDNSLKALMKHISSAMPQDESTKEMLKEFIMTTIMMTEGTEAGKDLSDTFEKFRDGTTNFSQDLNATLETFDNITMLGDQGIVIDYLINSQGYVVSQTGVIDLFMNTQQVDDALEKLSPTGDYPESNRNEFLEATATFGLRFSSETSKINENITIEFPALTPENSINFNDLGDFAQAGGKALRQQAVAKKTPTSPKSVIVSAKAIEHNVKPIIIGKHVVLPLDQVCKSLGVTYKKGKNDSYSIAVGKKTIRFTSNSNEITVNNAPAMLSLPVMKIEDRLFVPQDFVESYLDATVAINKKDNTAAIIKK